LLTIYITDTMNPDAITSMLAENASLKARVQELTDQLEWFKRHVFGQKSERVVGTSDLQCALALDGIPTSPPSAKTERKKAAGKFPRNIADGWS
jgi:hypothetical protein